MHLRVRMRLACFALRCLPAMISPATCIHGYSRVQRGALRCVRGLRHDAPRPYPSGMVHHLSTLHVSCTLYRSLRAGIDVCAGIFSDLAPALDVMASTQTTQMAKKASKTSMFGTSFRSETCALVRPLAPHQNTRHVRRDLGSPRCASVTVTVHRYFGPPDIDIVPAEHATLSPMSPQCNILCKVGERNFGVRVVAHYEPPFLDKRSLAFGLVLVPGSCSRPNISGHPSITSLVCACKTGAGGGAALYRCIGITGATEASSKLYRVTDARGTGEARPGVWRRQGWLPTELSAPADLFRQTGKGRSAKGGRDRDVRVMRWSRSRVSHPIEPMSGVKEQDEQRAACRVGCVYSERSIQECRVISSEPKNVAGAELVFAIISISTYGSIPLRDI